MRFMRLVQIITGASSGRQPPLRPVPAPRGTKRDAVAAAGADDRATSPVVRGSTTTSGARCSSV